jgi:4-amino-4-deoxy-L-arabinose transferase-like glycosyltransferase
MTQDSRLDMLARGWRGRVFAALLALAAGLPGLMALPPVDRGESLSVEAASQMLENGDFVGVNFQEQPLNRTMPGAPWLQAAAAAVLSSAEARSVWAYRVPSLLGAMLAAAACAWGAAAFFGPGRGMVAGAVLAGTMGLSTLAGIGTGDAVFCGTVTLALAALAQIHHADTGGPPAGRRTKAVFWLGLALAIAVRGWAALLMVALTGLALGFADRRATWARSLGWIWGLVLIIAVVGPWAMAITIRTDGQFWTSAVAGGRNGLLAPPGFHALLAPLLLFPATALLPAALAEGWRARAEPGVRFALCWLVPSWLLFEIAPVKLVQSALPAYGALAWLAAATLTRPWPRWSRWTGAALSVVAGVLLAAAAGYGVARLGARGDLGLAIGCEALLVAAGLAGAAVVLTPYRWDALAAAGVLGLAAHTALMAGLVPRLQPLWLSAQIAAVLDKTRLNPQGGLTPGPVTVVGYVEPSLVFLLGDETELGDIEDGARAVSEGRPTVVEARHEPNFLAELAKDRLKATAVGAVEGFEYALRRNDRLTIYRSDSPPPQAAQQGAAP